jgi:hypothetical protein
MPVKVYSFSCKFAYPEEAALFEHQFTLKSRHRNSLTEILLKGRAEYRAVIKEHLGLDVVALQMAAELKTAEIKAIKDEISAWKQRNGSRKTHPELAATLRQLQYERAPLYAQIKAAKQAAKEDPVIAPLVEACNKSVNDKIKEIRNVYSSTHGLYWPNYLDNERSAAQARFQAMDPKFNRWTGEGDLSLQFQGGLLVSDLFKCEDARLRLISPDPASVRSGGQIRGRARHVKAQYRVQSNNGNPQWINLNVVMHRLPPADGVIKWAHLSRVKSPGAAGKSYISLTKDYDYTLRLTVEEEPNEIRKQGKVMIEVGWRKLPAGLLVAIWLGDDGDTGELYLPPKWLDGKRKVEDLESIIDKNAMAMADRLKVLEPSVIQTLGPAGTNVRRITGSLLRLYRENPKIQLLLEDWRKQHLHLLRWKKGLHGHLMRNRKDVYRNFVCALSKKYSICGIEDFDLRDVTEKDIAKDQVHQIIKWQRTCAAVSSLKMMLSQKFSIEKFQSERRLHAVLAIKGHLTASR